MAVHTIDRFHKGTGRLKGCYVYMLICRDDGPMYIKVGITEHPTTRLQNLRNGCPVTPRIFASIETYSRNKARTIEGELHKAFGKWSAHGEWFKLTNDDKPEFNRAWKRVIAGHQKTGWPLKWEQIDIAKWVATLAVRKAHFQRKYVTRGMAYQDFVKALAS